jgi:hypothetical protein
MRTIYIVVEGQTEEEFVNNSLAPYMALHGILNTVPILLETSPGFYGGDISFSRYEKNIRNILISDPNAIVTSLIDFYQLMNDFPGYATSLIIPNANNCVAFLEKEISAVIVDKRFLPYIQLHEFEGLLFVDTVGFDYLPHIKAASKAAIAAIILAYPNPELINNGPTTAPSKRLKSLIYRYKKPFHGPLIALENGINSVLAKCPRFNVWVHELIKLASN